jgi:hypothetical protein
MDGDTSNATALVKVAAAPRRSGRQPAGRPRAIRSVWFGTVTPLWAPFPVVAVPWGWFARVAPADGRDRAADTSMWPTRGHVWSGCSPPFTEDRLATGSVVGRLPRRHRRCGPAAAARPQAVLAKSLTAQRPDRRKVSANTVAHSPGCTCSKRCGWPAAVPSGSRPEDAVLQARPSLLPAMASAPPKSAAHRTLLVQPGENASAICRGSQLRSPARQPTPRADIGRQWRTCPGKGPTAAGARRRLRPRAPSQPPDHCAYSMPVRRVTAAMARLRRNRVASPSSPRVVLGITTAGGRPPTWTPHAGVGRCITLETAEAGDTATLGLDGSLAARRPPHNCAGYGAQRPAEMLDSMAVGRGYMVRMGSPVRFRRGAPHPD